MNIWENAVFTQKGLALLAKLTSGNTLSLTRVAAGSGFAAPTMLPYQTAVTNEKQDLAFATQSYPEAGMCAVPVRLDNEALKEGYQANQVGIYAFDPDDGEILYLIAQAIDALGNPAGPHIPAGTEMPGYSAEWTFYIEYGQADGVTVTVDPSNAVTAAEVATIVNEHNESKTPHSGVLATQSDLNAHINANNNPHGVSKEQLGLGNVENTADSVKRVAYATSAGESDKIKNSLIIQLKGGQTEGTDKFTFNGSAGKSIDITAAKLGLGNVNNTADNDKYVAFAREANEARQLQNSLTIRLNGGRTEGSNMWTFDGSTGRTINITPSNIGAAEADHTHSYAAANHTHPYVPLSGGTMTGPLTLKKIILTADSYGSSLPSSGTAGQLFFKKVT